MEDILFNPNCTTCLYIKGAYDDCLELVSRGDDAQSGVDFAKQKLKEHVDEHIKAGPLGLLPR